MQIHVLGLNYHNYPSDKCKLFSETFTNMLKKTVKFVCRCYRIHTEFTVYVFSLFIPCLSFWSKEMTKKNNQQTETLIQSKINEKASNYRQKNVLKIIKEDISRLTSLQ